MRLTYVTPRVESAATDAVDYDPQTGRITFEANGETVTLTIARIGATKLHIAEDDVMLIKQGAKEDGGTKPSDDEDGQAYPVMPFNSWAPLGSECRVPTVSRGNRGIISRH